MTFEEKAQKLHDRATRGEQLPAEEQTALQNWYDDLDRAEDLLINKHTDGSNLFELARITRLAKLREVSQAALEVASLARQRRSYPPRK